jgi:hypothetical protein
MASGEPSERQPASAGRTMAFYRLACVVGAARDEPARAVEVRRDEQLVSTHERDQYSGDESLVLRVSEPQACVHA